MSLSVVPMDRRIVSRRRAPFHRARSAATRLTRSAAMLVALCTPVLVTAQQDTTARASADTVRRAARLFRSDSVLEITLTTDLRPLLRDRDTASARRRPATLAWKEGDSTITLPAQLRTRGHFRLTSKTCAFPPLKLYVEKTTVRGSVFQGQSEMKLVTHCQPDDDFEQGLLQEYLIYRLFNLVTPYSFRARLARVTYVDNGRDGSTQRRYGILLEEPEDMARRNGSVILAQKGAGIDDVDPFQMDVVAVMQYLIGNTDYSVSGLHNIVLVRHAPTFTIYPVAYDFDWSGLVNARYAKPAEVLRLASVRERLYRGPCRKGDTITPVLDLMRAKRAEFYALFRDLPGLDRRTTRSAHDYFGEFFDTINDGRRVRRELLERCRSELP